VPFAALVSVVAILRVPQSSPLPAGTTLSSATPPSSFRADDVKLDQELVSSFDAIGRLADGELVRFRCRQWMDEVVLHDSGQGVTVQQLVPRVEIVPVRFETY
jgi:hypothetical protein